MRKAMAISMVLILVATLFVLSPSAAATKPEDATITIELRFTGPDSATGAYFTSGALDGDGSASMIYMNKGNTAHGAVTLIKRGGTGEIKFKFQSLGTITQGDSGTISGQFTLMDGSGVYMHLHGVGSFSARFGSGRIDGKCSGYVHWN